MKKAERFISKYSWLLKLGICIALALWATQFGSYGKELYFESESNLPSIEVQRHVAQEMELFVEDLIVKAKAKGEDYGSKDYFNDLRSIDKIKSDINKRYSCNLDYSPLAINNLLGLSLANAEEKNQNFAPIHLDGEAEKYREKLERKQADEFYAMSPEDRKQEMTSISSDVKSWLTTLYARGTLLAWALFLLMMRDRKGILVTILSDKKKFFLALLLWPLFIWKYPANVVREIVVEAELRRIGNFFRKLTAEEKKLIQRVSGSKGFLRWIREFHLENVHLFERSLAIGLFAVIVVNFIYAGESQSHEVDLSRDGPNIQSEFSLEKADHSSLELKLLDNSVSYVAFVEEKFKAVFRSIVVVSIIIFEEKMFYQKLLIENIEHIPIC
ncbi:MAG: hypothetical protein UR60_C0047G0014 [Candidatus Moranbacteria bacterium GW2011_GWF2_34_56]|nr:MAG: hypothetical protein UR51_C0009G0003 [Candidatus Moranbacteria bacterium GW2011_GWF1_34_10]KKP63274.1 MAG: hypothetical protein UR60_C0047G0014 [Candidatus Moranbacteria bacterium GW2011_GWF2_34_56]HBI17557.1 hypothetical protein [Candidatus Moranbacteria bacterium]